MAVRRTESLSLAYVPAIYVFQTTTAWNTGPNPGNDSSP